MRLQELHDERLDAAELFSRGFDGRRRLDLWQLGGDFRKDLGFWMLKDDSDHLRAAVEPVCCHGGTSERWSAGLLSSKHRIL